MQQNSTPYYMLANVMLEGVTVLYMLRPLSGTAAVIQDKTFCIHGSMQQIHLVHFKFCNTMVLQIFE